MEDSITCTPRSKKFLFTGKIWKFFKKKYLIGTTLSIDWIYKTETSDQKIIQRTKFFLSHYFMLVKKTTALTQDKTLFALSQKEYLLHKANTVLSVVKKRFVFKVKQNQTEFLCTLDVYKKNLQGFAVLEVKHASPHELKFFVPESVIHYPSQEINLSGYELVQFLKTKIAHV